MAESAHRLLADYETWLGSRIEIVAADLETKHREMRTHAFRFLRGSFPLWQVRAAEEIPEIVASAAVPAVGDLHVENFGTWRDHDRVRRWGVNDLDELVRGPWALDLVRLAVSACLTPHVDLADDDVCAVLWDCYGQARPGPALDLADPDARHLDKLLPVAADAAGFYAGLAAGPAASPPADVAAAAERSAGRGWTPTWHARRAGTGSLGHRRLVGVGAAADGRTHAREAKQLGPPSVDWAVSHGWLAVAQRGTPYDAVLRAIHGPAAALRVRDWQLRDLAPDVVRIELAGLDPHHARRLLRAMAVAVRGVHGAVDSPNPAGVDVHAFTDAVHVMKQVTEADFRAWGSTPR